MCSLAFSSMTAGGAAAEKPPGVIAGEGVLEIGRTHKRFKRFIRKLLGKKVGEAVVEFLT